MKIQRIKLNNIGPYANDNEFDFNVADSSKHMVLIGGKNGAGKTTLFKAIKLCLYGCIAYGFESANAKYYVEVEKIINANEKLKRIGHAKICIDLLLDDGKYDNTYTFIRKWRVTGKRISETFDVYKNEVVLNNTEKDSFQSYILHLIPPNLFRFYFFDGEKLSDFVFSGGKDSDFREAFLKLCNLDTIEIIRENFRRISKAKAKDSLDFSQEYDNRLNEDTMALVRVEKAEEEYKDTENLIISINEELANLEKVYAKGGGISKKEWKAMQDQILREETRREEKRRWLKDIANNVLPFIILNHQMEGLKDQIQREHKEQIGSNVKTAIDTPEIQSIIKNVLDSCGVELSVDITKRIINEIGDYAKADENTTSILNLSDFDRYELSAKINTLLSFDITRIKKATDDIEASLNCVKRIRKKMEKSSVDNYDEYLQKKLALNERKAELSNQLLELDKELQKLRADKAVAASKLAKAKFDYESILKKKSINDISARALLAFNELKDVLYAKSIKTVESEFEARFKALINKFDLIDGIHIDDDLNVLPYKNKQFYAEEIRKSLMINGTEYIIAQIGLHAFEVLQEKLASRACKFVLPVEVQQQLSAGEKQIFVMALYQALSQLNKISVPYIIDTPFARIDKEHRCNILKHFFKQLKGQIIILSTDEEIVSNYMDEVSDVISNTFVLNHTNAGNTEILANRYFGGTNP